MNQLGDLPRGELLELINSASAQSPSSGDSISSHAPSEGGLSRGKTEDATANLEALEQEPLPYANWDESKVGPGGIPPVPDDVNALSMNVSRQSSYLGVSSIAAALRVISKINKALEHVIIGSPPRTAQATRSNSPRRQSAIDEPVAIAEPILSESQMVDAYFYHLHPLIPMIDEARFRVRFSVGERKNPSWVALLNMVFALGIIAGSTAEDNSHLIYYQRAKDCISLEVFGNGHIEALQALGLMGGLYLHYESRPNMANAIMGAALRMACALGLHREYADGSAKARPDYFKKALLIPREVRRRTWWSLFCMDTWATTTQGRPSLGRIGPAVTVQPPSYLGAPPNHTKPESISDDDAFVIILSQEVAFCKIATRIQDRLAEIPLLPPEETRRFDNELKNWRSSLPPLLRASEPCPERIVTPRAVMSWRYHNLRLVLHRPLLLNNALRSSLEQDELPSEDEMRSVFTCRQIAVDTIDDIYKQWRPTQISGWNSCWLLYQASMAPLVTIFAEYNRKNMEEVHKSQMQIEQVIGLLAQMAQWSITARKTRNFMIKIYDLSRTMINEATYQFTAQAAAAQEQAAGISNLRMDEHVPAVPSTRLAKPSGRAQPLYSNIAIMTPSSAMSHMRSTLSGMPLPGRIEGNPPPSMMRGPHTTFMNQDELNTFWNQVIWGEGEMPDFMMDTSYDGADYDFVPSYQNWGVN